MNGYIQKILTKEMTRKEFLSYFGLFLLTIFGISALFKNLSSLNSTTNFKQPKTFGSGPYGV